MGYSCGIIFEPPEAVFLWYHPDGIQLLIRI
jgi:hypothetical protein